MSTMSVNPESLGSEEQRQQFNTEGAEELRQSALQTRLKLINYAVRIVAWRAEQDEAAEEAQLSGESDSDQIGLYTLPDSLHGLIKDDKLPETLKLKWVRRDDAPQEGDKQLIVYVPVDQEGRLPSADAGDGNELDADKLPDEIFLAITHDDDSVSRYIVSKDGIFQYESAGEKGEQDIYDEFHPREFQRQITRRVDTGLPLTDEIWEDLINMNTVPQVTIFDDPNIPPVYY